MNPIIRRLKLVHARLEAEIKRETRAHWTDQARVMRLKKLKLALKDRLHSVLAGPVRAR